MAQDPSQLASQITFICLQGMRHMNLVMDQKNTLPFGVAVVTEVERLSAIRDKFCDAIILQRDMPENVKSWINTLGTKNLPSGRVTLKRENVSSAVQQLCEIAEMPVGSERAWFEADISALAAHFSKILNSKYIRLRLDVVTTDACRKFHVDAVQARLICTYKGLGTQIGNLNENGEVVSVKQLETGVPMILRGTLWPRNAEAKLMHRSPPIEKLGAKRLLLVLDVVDDPEDAV